MILGPTEYTAFQRDDTGQWVSAHELAVLPEEERARIRRVKLNEADVKTPTGAGAGAGEPTNKISAVYEWLT